MTVKPIFIGQGNVYIDGPPVLVTSTHTFVTMDVPAEVYDIIRAKFIEAGYDHVIMNEDQPDEALDMTGIAITKGQA